MKSKTIALLIASAATLAFVPGCANDPIARANGARVCFGDSGGPVVAQDRRGTYIWGVASAVISRAAPCGGYVVIAPAAQVFSATGMR